MVFKNMGAYTLSGAVPFNGIPLARCIYVTTESLWDTISKAFDETTTSSSISSLDESTNSATTQLSSCAIAASKAFNRTRSMSISLVEDGRRRSLVAVIDSDADTSSTSSGEDVAQVVDLIGEVGGVVVEQQEEVDCAITC